MTDLTITNRNWPNDLRWSIIRVGRDLQWRISGQEYRRRWWERFSIRIPKKGWCWNRCIGHWQRRLFDVGEFVGWIVQDVIWNSNLLLFNDRFVAISIVCSLVFVRIWSSLLRLWSNSSNDALSLNCRLFKRLMSHVYCRSWLVFVNLLKCPRSCSNDFMAIASGVFMIIFAVFLYVVEDGMA